MTSSDPVLVIDLGNTLLKRTVAGPVERSLQATIEMGAADNNPTRMLVRNAVLTGSSRVDAAESVVKALRLSRAAQVRIEQALNRDEGDVSLIDGALELLDTARSTGWRVLVATNAAAWMPPLPNSLASRVDGVASSFDIGYPKEVANFWELLKTRWRLEPEKTLVVGDSREADVSTPTAAGFLALHVDGTTMELSALRRWIVECPPPRSGTALICGQPRRWGGRMVVECPHLRRFVESVTRLRVRIYDARGMSTGTIVRRRDKAPALLSDVESLPSFGWAIPRRDARTASPPTDLASALQTAGVTLDVLPTREARHLVSLVREAKDPTVRRQRIASVVSHLTSLGKGGGGVPGAV